MQFITILVCLIIERWSHFGKKIRTYKLYDKYIAFCEKTLKPIKLNHYLFIGAVLLPALIIAGIIYVALWYSLFGILALAFSIFALLYCLGSFDFSKENVDTIFDAAHNHIFSVIFWAIILGPAGAITYRLNNELTNYYKASSDISKTAKKLKLILDWIPIRLETFAYALIGHFAVTIGCWLEHFLKAPEHNEKVLNECAKVALDKKKSSNDARALIDRALIVWLVIMALVVVL
jgi:membrane protein required for beta-lactamase induction